MSKASQQLVERLGGAGLARVLDDLLDHKHLVRLANTCGVKYPGMRTQSQRRDRLVADLAGRAADNVSAGEAIRRMLERETTKAIRNWKALSIEEKARRIGDESFLDESGKTLGLHLWILAHDGAELDRTDVQRTMDRLLRRAANGHAPAAAATATAQQPAREGARLKKRVASLEKKVKHVEAQLVKAREAHKVVKRDLIQRKGELAEARMLAERLRGELAEARAAVRMPAGKAADAAPAGGELEQSVRKLATEQRRLTRRLSKTHPVAAPAPGKELERVTRSLDDLRQELERLRKEGDERHAAHLGRIEDLRAAVRSAPARRARRQRAQGKAERVGVFVDVQNMYYAARKLKGKLDFDALMQAAVRERRLVRATAYVVESKETDQSQFIARLEQLALDVKRKTVQVRADGSMKGDWDMELALDILDMVSKLDVVVLVSGDGDFTSLVKRVKSAGPRVEVIAFPRHTAKSLLEAADHFQPLDRKFMIYRRRAAKKPVAGPAPRSREAAGEPSSGTAATPDVSAPCAGADAAK